MAVAIVATKGPVGKVQFLPDWDTTVDIFGSDLSLGYGLQTIRTFFTMGGSRVWAVRTAHYEDITDPESHTATTATRTITDGEQTPTDVLKVSGESPGTYHNSTVIVIENANQQSKTFDLKVIRNNRVLETFLEVSVDPASPKFAERIINQEPFLKSRNIVVDVLDETKVPQDGTYALTGGSNGLTGIDDTDFVGDAAAQNGLYALDEVPEIFTLCIPGKTSANIFNESTNYVLNNRNRNVGDFTADFFISDLPPGMTPWEAVQFARQYLNRHSLNALYYPWVIQRDRGVRYDPTVGYVAAVYSKNDQIFGPWRAPAGMRYPLNIDGLAYNVKNADQELLYPQGINSLLRKPQGFYIWGVRTGGAVGGGGVDSGTAFMHVSTQRLFNLVKKSIKDGTQWAVFEPNGPVTWQRLKDSAESYLLFLHSMGAFAGFTPEESFFVKVDRETNPPHLRERGILHGIIGIAPVKPAEFIWWDLEHHPYLPVTAK